MLFPLEDGGNVARRHVGDAVKQGVFALRDAVPDFRMHADPSNGAAGSGPNAVATR